MAVACCSAAAGPPPKDPDWPCVQRLVPTLTAGTFWAGHGAGRGLAGRPGRRRAGGSRGAPQPAGRSRQRGAEDASHSPRRRRTARPGSSACSRAWWSRPTRNASQVIERLRGVARRQRDLTGMVAQVTAQLRALPADASDAEREEVDHPPRVPDPRLRGGRTDHPLRLRGAGAARGPARQLRPDLAGVAAGLILIESNMDRTGSGGASCCIYRVLEHCSRADELGGVLYTASALNASATRRTAPAASTSMMSKRTPERPQPGWSARAICAAAIMRCC